MKRKQHITAFYLETLLLVLAFIVVILILVQCFAAAEHSREEARQLSGAVNLAKNAAEAVSEAGDAASLAVLLAEDGNAEMRASSLTLRYDQDFTPDPKGTVCLRIAWSGTTGRDDGMIAYEITVEDARTRTEIYSLETAVYPRRDAA